jgi:hypothetical protein
MFENEQLITIDTKCAKCWKDIYRGIYQGKVGNGNWVIFCIECHQWSKVQSGEFAREQIAWRVLNSGK